MSGLLVTCGQPAFACAGHATEHLLTKGAAGWSTAQLTMQAEHAVQRSATRASELREAGDGLILTVSPHISLSQVSLHQHAEAPAWTQNTGPRQHGSLSCRAACGVRLCADPWSRALMNPLQMYSSTKQCCGGRRPCVAGHPSPDVAEPARLRRQARLGMARWPPSSPRPPSARTPRLAKKKGASQRQGVRWVPQPPSRG